MNYCKMNKQKSYYKSANPSLEKCPIAEDLSITINSAETYPLLKAWVTHYIYMLKTYINPYMIIKVLYPELSPRGRLHYHGIVRFKTHKQCVDWYFRRQHIDGINISLDTIKDKAIWLKYITKQRSYLDKLITPYKLTPSELKGTYVPQSIREQMLHSIG